EIDTPADDDAYYRPETGKHADEKDLEMNFSKMTGRSVADDYIGVDHIEIDVETSKGIGCPQGYEPILSVYESALAISTARLNKEHCQECHLLANWQVKEQKKAYHSSFSENKRRTDETRAKMGTERHKELSNYRAGVEGVPSVLKRAYQLDNLPVRGQV